MKDFSIEDWLAALARQQEQATCRVADVASAGVGGRGSRSKNVLLALRAGGCGSKDILLAFWIGGCGSKDILLAFWTGGCGSKDILLAFRASGSKAPPVIGDGGTGGSGLFKMAAPARVVKKMFGMLAFVDQCFEYRSWEVRLQLDT
eukprot:g46715.t1